MPGRQDFKQGGSARSIWCESNQPKPWGRNNVRAKTCNREGRDKEARKQVLENRKITREIAKRAHQIRLELGASKQRYDGALMDNFYNGIPVSLDVGNENREPYGAVDYLCPPTKGPFDDLQKGIFESCLSEDVGTLYFHATQIAYSSACLPARSTLTVRQRLLIALNAA